VPAPALLGPGLVGRRVTVAASDVVYVRGVLEASEGVGALFAEHGGELLLAAPVSKVRELDELLRDLRAELGTWIEGPEL
jgi:hypothetical protein